jgi:predicted nucleic acid-binding protein
MDDLVADSSVAVKWFVVEPDSTEARRILTEYQAGSLAVLAPDLIYVEVGNIIWKKQRFHGLQAADARLIIQTFQTLPLKLTSSADLLEEAYELAVAHERTVYDCVYLALSLREKCPFVTADEKLVNALSPAFPNVVPLAQWS